MIFRTCKWFNFIFLKSNCMTFGHLNPLISAITLLYVFWVREINNKHLHEFKFNMDLNSL